MGSGVAVAERHRIAACGIQRCIGLDCIPRAKRVEARAARRSAAWESNRGSRRRNFIFPIRENDMNMNQSIGLAVVLAVFAVGGYAAGSLMSKDKGPGATTFVRLQKQKPPKNCPGNTCDTDVSVFSTFGCPANCSIEVKDDVLVVKKNATLTWTIQPSNATYQFAANGITFATGYSGCDYVQGSNKKQFRCPGSNVEGPHKYSIAVESTDGTANPPALDPYVVNN
jgi:hypothetical protein